MLVHFFYNIALVALRPFFPRQIGWIVALTYPWFLLTLPSTGWDFDIYQIGYEQVFFNPSAPLFFSTSSVLTAEPGWLLYTGIMHNFIADFRVFLVVNFGLTIWLVWRALGMIGFDREMIGLMIVLMLPVIFPVLFFWSPRSSISLGLCLYGIALFHNRRYLLSLLVIFAATQVHSQYLPISLVAISSIWFARLAGRVINQYVAAALPALGIIVTAALATYILPFLTFLPTYSIIAGKITALESDTEAMRLTGLLSIFFYPLMLFILRKREKNKPYFLILVIFSAFSAIANIAFFNNSHIAGRLSRASDYILLPYVLAAGSKFFSTLAGTIILLLFTASFPFFYGDFYDFEEFFLLP